MVAAPSHRLTSGRMIMSAPCGPAKVAPPPGLRAG
jgi:hypothetical protein